jgi:hypothetical protein
MLMGRIDRRGGESIVLVSKTAKILKSQKPVYSDSDNLSEQDFKD